MIGVYLGILAAYLLLFLFSARETGNPFQKMAACILRQKKSRSGKRKGGRDWKRELGERQLGDKLKTLHPGLLPEKQVEAYYLSLYSLVLMVVFVGNLLCLAVWISARSSPKLIDGNVLPRNTYGEGQIEVGLAAEIPGIQEEVFDYLVEERQFTQQEIEEQYERAQALLPTAILGENEKPEDVRTDLELVSELADYPFQISWESSAYSLVDTDGTVHNEELTAGEVVTLTAQFRYEDWKRDCQLFVQINPAVYTPQEAIRSRVEELLKENAEETKSAEAMTLPDRLGAESIVWREIIEDNSGYFLLLILVAAGAVYWGRGRELDQKLEERKRELLLDYPEIVNKLALYMGAGMTIRNAFFKMGEDYKRQREQRKRYVYEEILITCYELQGGRSETEAYERFGKRCQVQVYIKLAALLAQNIRKGSNDLLRMFRQEADNAFHERKNLAKKLGEEAGTKLLMPMMIMLCVVMVIIMIPAYFSFTV
ncbi:MAG: type II secretion system F family protein [Bacteroidales bacterium]|nr:type II secretion system F family protein [Bacteroidales bacterium]MCM1415568.1 type II secretion system F family protein [bacterium]MCM1424096.1 type II secretion system F family protein [bacterium]